MKNIYLTIITLSICATSIAQQLDFNYPVGQHLVEYIEAENYASYEIQIHTDNPEPITYQYQLLQNTFPSSWTISTCDYTSCYVGIPSADIMDPISQADADNGAYGFLKMNITVAQNYGQGIVAYYVYEAGNFSRGDTVSWELIWILAGDANGNGVLDQGEIAGDIDNNGIIDGNEIAGDFNGNGTINDGEVAGDIDGNGSAGSGEKVGDLNGDGTISGSEVWGDANGNGVLDNGEATSIIEYASNNLKLYPNPTSDIINISGEEIQRVSLYNILGEVVYSSNENSLNTAIDVSELENGIYIVSVTSVAGVTSSHKITVN